jgi:hypothetical protein
VLLLVWYLPFDLSGLGGPTSSYATAGIALWVIGTHKPHHHDQVEAPSVGSAQFRTTFSFVIEASKNHPGRAATVVAHVIKNVSGSRACAVKNLVGELE